MRHLNTVGPRFVITLATFVISSSSFADEQSFGIKFAILCALIRIRSDFVIIQMLLACSF